MALLAETLVEEWLNRQGYFTIRGIKEGVDEIDLLAVRPLANFRIEALHVEVQVSLRPVSFLAKLTPRLQRELGKAPGSAYPRTDEMLQECVSAWVGKKFEDRRKARRREALWPGGSWQWTFVHGVVKEPRELQLIAATGIRLVPLAEVLDNLCHVKRAVFSASAGTDLADLIEFYARYHERTAHSG
jgi:hypothetical protein